MDIGSLVGEEREGELLFDKVRKRFAAKVTDLNRTVAHNCHDESK